MQRAAEPAEQAALLRAVAGAKAHELRKIAEDVACMAQLQAWMVALVQAAQRSSQSLQNLLLLLKVGASCSACVCTVHGARLAL